MTDYSTRQSNFELLRLVSMLLVLMLHAYGVALGNPSKIDFQLSPLSASFRVLMESLSLICVNVFVLISGWFGIKPSIKGFASFLFQCLFFSIGVTIVAPLIGIGNPLRIEDVGSMLFFGKYYYWFIKCYICLYILAPVLNSFVETAQKRVVIMVILCLFIMQTIYGWTGTMLDFDRGYSVLSFALLYLIARYIRIYGGKIFNLNQWQAIAINFGLTLAIAAVYTLAVNLDMVKLASHWLVFINPLVVISSVFFLLFFSKMNFQSKAINYLSRSAFAVYLFHLNTKIWDGFLETCYTTFTFHNGVSGILLVLCFLLIVYIVSVLIDQIRLLCWKPIGRRLDSAILKNNDS